MLFHRLTILSFFVLLHSWQTQFVVRVRSMLLALLVEVGRKKG